MVFNFNTPPTTTAATPGFSFGAPASTAPATGGFGFGQQTAATTTASGGFGFGQQTAPTAAVGGFGFGQTTATTVTTAGGFGFGQTGTTNAEAKPTFSFVTSTQASNDAAAKPFASLGGFGGPATSTPTGSPATTKAGAPLSFLGQTATTTTPASTFAFAPATATSTSGAATTSLSSGPSLQKTSSSTGFAGTTNTGPAATGFASLTTATKTTDSSAIPTSSQISFNQIEEYINKWTMELEDQEKVFLDQATQINAWDRVLNSNSSLILELNEAVQKVMSEQTTLECELAYIENQHRDVDENIQILEKEFTKLPQVDVERSQAYLLVENLDTQLKQMSEDLKEIIDCLNEASQIGDSTDPIIQVGKILNAHMNSLQWIETTSAKIFKKLEDVGKAHEKYKRDNERSRNSYYR